jgi:phospholipase/carboxylesterase
VLLLRPEALHGAVLLRPMMPLRTALAVELDGKPVLLLSGAMDPIANEDSTARLASALGAAGADVLHRELPAGHELSQADIAAARGWLGSAAREPEAATT